MQLRPYQRASLDNLYAYWMNGSGDNPLLVAPTGSGKSFIQAALMQEAIEHFDAHTRIVSVTHVMELIEQNYLELTGLWEFAPAGVFSAGLKQRCSWQQIVFAGIHSVHRRAKEIGHVDILVVDECFPAGTPVSTPNGPIPIEYLCPGDVVHHALGEGEVEGVRTSSSDDIWTVELSNGETIECTGNHPFFTPEGYVEARQLEVGGRLFRVEDVRALQNDVSSLDKEGRSRQCGLNDETRPLEETTLLLDLLLEEARECDEQSGHSRKDERDSEEDGTSAEHPRRERQGVDRTAKGVAGDFGGWLDSGACGPDRLADGNQGHRRGVPNKLQTGFGQSRSDDRHRAGRQFSRFASTTNTGSEEGQAASVVRVVRVARAECQSPRTVYNLQVAGHPSFFAHGVLVHNCHLIPRNSDTMYRRFIDALMQINPDMKVVGLTATPFRLDSGRLDDGEGRVFDGIAYEIAVSELMRDGYLAPLISKGTDAIIDVGGVHRRGGDFKPGELQEASDRDEVTRAAVAETVSYFRSQNRHAGLAFTTGVDHAEHVAEYFRSHGVQAEVVSDRTSRADRRRIIEAFKSGEIPFVVNVNVMTTGFNAPHVDIIADLAPTLSTGRYVQKLGRGTRAIHAPGYDLDTRKGRLAAIAASRKQNALVLDFARNTERHGPFDDPIVREPGKGDGEPPVKLCEGCSTFVPISVRTCPECGHEFEVAEEVKITETASAMPVMTTEANRPQWIGVDSWFPHIHEKRRDNGEVSRTLRVEYQTGMQIYKEWLCFGRDGFAGDRAAGWWRERGGPNPPPASPEEAIQRWNEVCAPAEILVRKEGKYWRVNGARGFAQLEAAEAF